jgi:probable HAF family extracellular repeat protein
MPAKETLMKKLVTALCATFLATSCVPELFAQKSPSRPTLYRIAEVGTFGGPNSVYNVFSAMARNDGTIVGAANTGRPDPNAPNCFDGSCFVLHAYEWHANHLTDLGVLPGGASSYTNAINHRGLIVGHSENGEVNPLSGFSAFKPTVWYRGHIIDLGTLGGYSGTAVAATDSNFVMGFAENDIVDNSGFAAFFGFGGGTEIHAFGWSGGNMFDLGSLGGPGAVVSTMNKHGQVVGFAPTRFAPGPFGTPPAAPYRWTNGAMRNLGTLGGKFGFANSINNHGHVVGSSSTHDNPYGCLFFGVPGCHPFLWSDGKMKDLGVPSGNYGTAELINDAGQVVGFEVPPDGSLQALMWQNGKITRLGTVAGDNNSRGFGMNGKGVVVGQSWNFDGQTTVASQAFVWRRGGPMLDLNTVLTNPSDLFLFEADFISDSGIIVAIGVKPNGDLHTAVLTPDDDPNAVARPLAASLSPQARFAIANRIGSRPFRGASGQLRTPVQH